MGPSGSWCASGSGGWWCWLEPQLTRGTCQEYHENNQEIILDNTEINHTVQIFGCKSSVIQIKGKVNAINMGTLGWARGLARRADFRL